MSEDEMPHREHPPPAPGGGGSGVRPGLMFRWGVYASLGVLAVAAAAAAVYTTRAVLVRVLIALFIAVSLDPAVRALTRRGMRRGTARRGCSRRPTAPGLAGSPTSWWTRSAPT